jgi:CHAT domain-containing protein
LLFALVGSAGCSKHQPPDAALDSIRNQMRRGDLAGALHNSDREYRHYENRDPALAWRFRVQKAHILILRGLSGDALQLLAPEPPSSLAHSEVAIRRKMLQGVAGDYLQQYDNSKSALAEAAELATSFQPDLLADVLQARGNLEVSTKDYLAASASFHQALELDRKAKRADAEANVLGSLGYVSMWQEHYDEAIEWFKLALQKSQAIGADLIVAKVLGNIGWNYSVVGDFDSAEDELKQAESASIKTGNLGDQVKWLNALADVYFQQHRYELAASTADQALGLARKVGNNRDITTCLNSAADIALATSKLDQAEKYNGDALAIERAGLDQYGVASSTIIAGRIAANKKQFSEAQRTFEKIIGDRTLETPLRWQAQAYLARVYADQNLPEKAEAQFRAAISTIQTARASVQRADFRVSFLSSAIQFYEAYIDFLVSRGRNNDALTIAELSRTQALSESFNSSSAARVKASRLDSQSVAARTRSTLFFYSLGEQHSYLWVITPSKTSLFTLPPEDQIAALVKTYRDELTNNPLDPLTQQNSSGSKLYGILVEPAAKLIAPNSRVIILPDAGLNTINFETLIVSSPQPHYWIEDVTLSVANSLSNLAGTRPMSSIRGASLLLVGNPVPADSTFPALPQAPAEIKTVEDYFPQSRRSVLTGSAATASAYYDSDPARFQYIHFVTHGTASRLQPLESAVILSPSGDSYKLYARDIVAHPLEASLVTISACNGAGNRAYAGEGLVGLSWAFLRAGAHNVISALWEVSDASTPQIMGSLYKGLSRGDDPATALRNAKLQLLHSSGVYKKPFYWAPFQLYTGS